MEEAICADDECMEDPDISGFETVEVTPMTPPPDKKMGAADTANAPTLGIQQPREQSEVGDTSGNSASITNSGADGGSSRKGHAGKEFTRRGASSRRTGLGPQGFKANALKDRVTRQADLAMGISKTTVVKTCTKSSNPSVKVWSKKRFPRHIVLLVPRLVTHGHVQLNPQSNKR